MKLRNWCNHDSIGLRHDSRGSSELIRLTGSASTLIHKPLAEIGDDELRNKTSYAQTWRFSNEKLKAQLAFAPRYPFHETLRATVMNQEM